MAGRCSRCELKRVMRCRGVLPKFPSFRTLLGGVSVGAISPLALNFKDSTLADTGQWVFGAVTQPDRCGMLRTPPPNCHCQLHTEFCHVVQLLKSDRTPDFVIGMPLQALALRLRNVWQAIEPLHAADSLHRVLVPLLLRLHLLALLCRLPLLLFLLAPHVLLIGR